MEIDLDIYGDCGLSVFRMSANGTFLPFDDVRYSVAIEGVADIGWRAGGTPAPAPEALWLRRPAGFLANRLLPPNLFYPAYGQA